MEKLYTGSIVHAFKNKKYYSILLPKGGYLVFKLNDNMEINIGDRISYYREFGTKTMYHIRAGDWFSVTVENIEVSSEYVTSLNRLD